MSATAITAHTPRRGPNRGKPLKILLLSPEAPSGEAFGGRLRARQIARALSEIGDVTVSLVSTDPVEINNCDFAIGDVIQAKLSRNTSFIDKARALMDVKYMNIHGYLGNPADRAKLEAQLPHYDFVWVLHSRTPNILGIWKWPNGPLDLDDIQSSYLRGIAARAENASEKWKAGIRAAFLQRREKLWGGRFATLSVCSEEDRVYLGGGDHVHVIPNGYEVVDVEPARNPCRSEPRLGFIGLCTYEPNRDGIRWFLEHCWPKIRLEAPGVRFRLAGAGSNEMFATPPEGVDLLGWIDDSGAEIATWSAMVIPLRLGGGTRVKLADAFSRKCPVVATSLGAYGYSVGHRRELMLADEAERFAASCVEIIRDPVTGAAMAERAHAAFLENWTWDAIAPRVWAAAEETLRRSKKPV